MPLWTLLDIAAWGFGAKATGDLRRELPEESRTWALLDWAVRLCLLMELAVLGAGRVPGLSLVAAALGTASGLMMWAGMSSLLHDVCADETRPPWFWLRDRWLWAAVAVLAAGALAGGRLSPEGARRLAGLLGPLEGGVWLAASARLVLSLGAFSCPRDRSDSPNLRLLAGSFAAAFAHALVQPLTLLSGWAPPPELGPLLGTLFVLVLVITLYGTAVRVRTQKLVESGLELRAALERLGDAERVAAVGNVAAGAAHDFGNFLMTITGLSELNLKTPGIPEAVRADLASINSAARAAAGISARMLGLVRRGGRGAFAEVRDAVEGSLALLTHEFRRRGIRVSRRIEDVPRGKLDPDLVAQVCLNLLLNARDAMSGAGVLEVSLERTEAGEALIRVKDDGPGIPPELQPGIFRANVSTKGSRGTGLGLSSSRVLVESMGGRIGFESRPGEGTEFWIRLPTGVAA